MAGSRMTGRPSPAVARSLALGLRPLGDLAAWDRVASLAERVASALRGDEGLDPRDARDLRVLSAAWTSLPPDVRSFYVSLLDARGPEASAARIALGHLLDGRPARLDGWVRGVLLRSWVDRYGVDPLFSVPPVTLWRCS